LIAFLALTFLISWGAWIPMVAALRGVIALPFSPFSLENVKDWPSLTTKLQQQPDGVSACLASRFTDATRQALADYPGSGPVSRPLQMRLLDELNQIIQGESIYDSRWFASVNVSEDAWALLRQKPGGKVLVRLNRLLVEDAYPMEVAGSLRAHSLRLWGAFGPGIAALIAAGMADGLNGMRRLFERFLTWRVGPWWYLGALLLPAVLSLMTISLHMAFGGEAPVFSDWPVRRTALWPTFRDYSVWAMILPLFVHQIINGTGITEELGWRGFALPRLQQRFEALTSSALLAGAWAVWSLPLSFVEGNPKVWWVLFFLVLCALPGSIITTWLFNNTRGSLLVTFCFNNAVKVTTLLLVAPQTQAAFELAPFWIVAIAIVAWAGAQRLSRQPLDENCRGESDGQDRAPAATAEPA